VSDEELCDLLDGGTLTGVDVPDGIDAYSYNSFGVKPIKWPPKGIKIWGQKPLKRNRNVFPDELFEIEED